MVSTNACVCVGAEAPDAVTVTLYVLGWDCCGCVLEEEDPQPARVSTKTKSKSQRALSDLPASPNQNRGSGETRARTNPLGAGARRAALVVLTVSVVLSGPLPDNVAGAKLQPHPLGSPEQANDSEALNPFSGATATVNVPGVPCVIVSVPLDNVSP